MSTILWHALDYCEQQFFLLILLVGMRLILTRDTAIGKEAARFIKLIIYFTLAYSLIDYVEAYYATFPTWNIERVILSWVQYSMLPLIIIFFIQMMTLVKRRVVWFYVIALVNALIYATTFLEKFKWLAFYFDAENDFTRGPLGFASHAVCIILMVALFGILFTRYKAHKNSDTLAVFFCALACVAAMLVETITTRSGYLPTTIIIACVFYYLFLHTQITRAETMEKELLLSDQRAAMTVSELKPRFIYDVIGNLRGLPSKDPKRAETAIGDLLTYLEMNMEATDFIHPVPFVDELDRTKKYLKIEQARLPHLRVDYEIEDVDFLIPALTVQQMVENCIRHGMDNNDKGTIVIKSFGSDSGHTVIIQDNGRGFSTEEAMTSENQGSRFGISNVTDRLQRMVDGDLNIVSSKDVGTTVMISIPNS